MKSKFFPVLFFTSVALLAAGCDSKSTDSNTQQVTLPPLQSQVTPPPQTPQQVISTTQSSQTVLPPQNSQTASTTPAP